VVKSPKKNRLAPPLMHAFREAFRNKDARQALDLRDDTGERIIASRRVTARSSVTETTLRQSLAEDLNALLNTVNLASAEDLSQFSYVARSILNYGITDITGYSMGENAIEDIAEELRTALTHYEPRLIPSSIEIKRDTSFDDAAQKFRFMISADMHSTPVDVPIEFIAELELDSGKMRVSRL
jgi:type VI secretion system protein ImpF